MTIAQQLRKIREEKNLTQEQMSRLVGLNTKQYGRYERGERSPSGRVLEGLAEKLGLKIQLT